MRKDPSNPSRLARTEGVDTIHDETRDDLSELREKGELDSGSKAGEKRLAELKKRSLAIPR